MEDKKTKKNRYKEILKRKNGHEKSKNYDFLMNKETKNRDILMKGVNVNEEEDKRIMKNRYAEILKRKKKYREPRRQQENYDFLTNGETKNYDLLMKGANVEKGNEKAYFKFVKKMRNEIDKKSPHGPTKLRSRYNLSE